MREKLFTIFIVVFLLASLAPTVYELNLRNTLPSIRQFELVHNFPTDFNFYLSRIRQGIEGNLTVREQYTSEPHQGSFIHVFYLFLGWLGAWVRVPWHRSADVYHVARIVFGGLLLVMIAQFCKKSFSSSPITHPFGLAQGGHSSLIAFLLAVTASTWPKLVFYNGGWRFGGYMPWWSVMDSLQRITFIPHLLVGQTLILFLILALSDEATMKRPGNWIFLGILAFILGVIFPPGLVFVIAAIGIFIMLEWLHNTKGVNFIAAASKLTPLALGLPSLLYLSLMTSFYPWKRLAEFDIVKPLPFNYTEYLLAVGPILPIGMIGLLIVLWRKEKSLFPAAAWVLAWGFLLFVFQFIPSQSPLRFSEMIPHVPLGILSVFLFSRLGNLGNLGHLGRKLAKTIPALMILVGFGVMYSSWLWQRDFIDHKIRAGLPLVPTGSYVLYPLKDFIAAITFIQDATPRRTVILSEKTAGNYIPVYSGNTVYVGHANTVDAERKELVVRQFFSGRMNAEEALVWLRRENLHWIFFGPEEREDGGISDLSRTYPFLKEVYANNFVKVYIVM